MANEEYKKNRGNSALTDYLMQDLELRVPEILRYAARRHGDLSLFSLDEDGIARSQTYAETQARVQQLTGALEALDLPPQSRIASLALNTRRHLELYYGVTAAGHILHTINPRFTTEQILFSVRQAETDLLFFDPAFAAQAEAIAANRPQMRACIVLGEPEKASALSTPTLTDYESFIADGTPSNGPPGLSERDGAFLCYTSGTTGDPKGVLYSHRSCLIHALAASAPGNFNIAPTDVILPCASMYHATAWALPMTAPMNGARLVLPGAKLDGASLLDLCEAEGVTLAWGVPTVWKSVLDAAIAQGRNLPKLERVFMGGSAVPPDLKRAFADKLDVEVVQVWGMTETSPMGVISTLSSRAAALPDDDRATLLSQKQGRIPFGVDLKLQDEADNELPQDGQTSGRLMIRGPWVVNQYFGHEKPVTTEDGWFDTGDVATIDPLGYMQITDRTKDIIKSGGEWISSITLENTAIEHPLVDMAAAISLAHPKWDERPLLVYTTRPGTDVSEVEVLEFLKSQLPRWWVPEAAVVVDGLPLTATGKVDKKTLRTAYAKFYQNNQ